MDIDLGVVFLYLIGTLVLGVWSGRGIKTMREYAVSNGSFPMWILVATIVASLVGGGSTIGLAEKTFSFGMVTPFFYVLGAASIAAMGLVAPYMKEYLGSAVSPGGLMHIFFGRPGEIITGIIGVLFSVGAVAAQVGAMGFIFRELLGVSYELGVFISFGVLVIYSMFGGIRAVVVTDVIQCIVMLVMIPLVAYFTISRAGGFEAMLANVPSDRTTLDPIFQDLSRYVPQIIIWMIPWMLPYLLQRLLMGENVRQIKNAFYISALIATAFMFVVIPIGLSALALNPQLDAHSAMTYVMQTAVPTGLKGCAIAGLMAVIMSTADSCLNIASVMAVCDLILPLRRCVLRDEQMLRYAQYTTLLLGLFSVLGALYFRLIINFIMYAEGLWFSVVTIPMLAGILGYKGSKQAFIWAAVAGSVAMASWHALGLERIVIYSLVGGLVNALVFFGLSEYGKHHGILEREEQEKKEKRKRILEEREQAHCSGKSYLKTDDWESRTV
ncbi:MAG: sodium:solute symporter family protein [Holosporales bacterium]|jgi:SSS family solute:Na+ symporter|nr:sodium:solute symporter family protein [Holosporales bacterium]